LLMLLIYIKGKMPGTSGVLKLKQEDFKIRKKFDVLKASALILFLIFTSTIFACSGIFYVYPLNDRLIWLIIFTAFSFPGFFMILIEFSSFNDSNITGNKRLKKGILTAFEAYPFYIYAAISGSLHGMIILSFVFSGGVLIHKIGKNLIITTFFQAFIINYLLLAQGVLYPSFF